MTIQIASISRLDEAAREFIHAMGEHRIFAFHGAMGAGKTTFISSLCRQLGVAGTVSSPTFAIVNEYEVARQTLEAFPQGEIIYHFDFYRINRLEEVYDLGYEEYLYSGRLCLIEWPEQMQELLPDDAVRVDIVENSDSSRTLTLHHSL